MSDEIIETTNTHNRLVAGLNPAELTQHSFLNREVDIIYNVW